MIPPRVSAAVLTLDEARNIGRCLASLTWADEIVVIDAGSTDATVEIARRYTDRVVLRPWKGFLEQRRLSFEECSHEWIVFLDADEWMGPGLAEEIRSVLSKNPSESAFWINRRNWFLDRWMDHAWSPDLVMRLFRKGASVLQGHEPHIHVRLQAGHSSGVLTGSLLHQAYHSISDLCVKADQYSRQFADSDATDALYAPWKVILSPIVSAFKTFVAKRGFLDGMHGLVVAWASAHYHFLKYARKWEKLRQAEAREAQSKTAVASPPRIECSREPEGHGK